ncbi:hypothetical protein FRB90_003961 [Tulasnella sp. 427]|nr:hypothetical protein FRB90_003961 [Tulasnella sp. 427]
MPPPFRVRPLHSVRRFKVPGSAHYYSQGSTGTDKSASAKLFADAVEEERSDTSTATSRVQELAALQASKQRNWDGDESTEDAVLRMLVDKYKPLRTGTIRTANDKLKEESSSMSASTSQTVSETRGQGVLLSSLPPIQSPTSFTGNKRLKPGGSGGRAPVDPDDAKARAESRRVKRLNEGPRRAGSALEKSLDYQFARTLGQGEGDGSEEAAPSIPRQVNPATMKGWASIVEEKIEQARSAGVFTKVEGRGKPIKRHHDEVNPFIPREEFLMNRIIRRQGAAPPWVEIQGELEGHIRTFRRILRENWVRTATRKILLSLPPPPYLRKLPPHMTAESIAAMRDPEWEKRELSYHSAALEEVNAQIRRHNGIAPFAARRGYLMREYELERCYESSAEEILESVKERLEDPVERRFAALGDDLARPGDVGSRWSLLEALKRLVMRLMPAPASAIPPGVDGDAPSSSASGTRGTPVV